MKAYLRNNRGFVTFLTLSTTIFFPLVILVGLAVAIALYSGVALGIGALKLTDGLRELSAGNIDLSDTD